MLDLRLPIGAMFALLGGMLMLYGALTPASMYRASLGYNLNLLWGAAMVVFALAMFAWMKARPEPAGEEAAPGGPSRDAQAS